MEKKDVLNTASVAASGALLATGVISAFTQNVDAMGLGAITAGYIMLGGIVAAELTENKNSKEKPQGPNGASPGINS